MKKIKHCRAGQYLVRLRFSTCMYWQAMPDENQPVDWFYHTPRHLHHLPPGLADKHKLFVEGPEPDSTALISTLQIKTEKKILISYALHIVYIYWLA